MGKDLTVGILLDYYGSLLTDKQLFVLDLYYNSDLSLAEIAEEINISRQGVRDSILRGEKALCGFEEKLGMYGLVNKFQETLDRLSDELGKLHGIPNIDIGGIEKIIADCKLHG